MTHQPPSFNSTHSLVQGFAPVFLAELWELATLQRSRVTRVESRLHFMWATMRYLTAIEVSEALSHIDLDQPPKAWAMVEALIRGLQEGHKLSQGDWSKALSAAIKLNVKHINRCKQTKTEHQLVLPQLAQRLNKQHQSFERMVQLRNIKAHEERGGLSREEREELSALSVRVAELLSFHRSSSLFYMYQQAARKGDAMTLITERGLQREQHHFSQRSLWGVFEQDHVYLLSSDASRALHLFPWLLVDQYSASRHITYLLSATRRYEFEPTHEAEPELIALKDSAHERLCELLLSADQERDRPLITLPKRVRLNSMLPPVHDIPTQVGSYLIHQQLGLGGFGAVYEASRASQAQRAQPVALKLLHRALSSLPKSQSRFQRECESLQRLNHPNIVELYDWGTDEQHGLFVVIELLGGGTLEDRARQGLSIDELVGYCKELLLALEYLHRQGYVHRDIKPTNIMFSQDGSLKLIDFGIAFHEGSEQLTQTLELLGTRRFAAPEQLEHRAEVDHRADLYAVGKTILYIARLLEAELPPRLLAIASRASQTDPSKRFQSARDLRMELESLNERSGRQPLLAKDRIQSTRVTEPVRELTSGYWLYLGEHHLNHKRMWLLIELNDPERQGRFADLSEDEIKLMSQRGLTIDHIEQAPHCTILIFEDGEQMMERLVIWVERWLAGDPLDEALRAAAQVSSSAQPSLATSPSELLSSIQAQVQSLTQQDALALDEDSLINELQSLLSMLAPDEGLGLMRDIDTGVIGSALGAASAAGAVANVANVASSASARTVGAMGRSLGSGMSAGSRGMFGALSLLAPAALALGAGYAVHKLIKRDDQEDLDARTEPQRRLNQPIEERSPSIEEDDLNILLAASLLARLQHIREHKDPSQQPFYLISLAQSVLRCYATLQALNLPQPESSRLLNKLAQLPHDLASLSHDLMCDELEERLTSLRLLSSLKDGLTIGELPSAQELKLASDAIEALISLLSEQELTPKGLSERSEGQLHFYEDRFYLRVSTLDAAQRSFEDLLTGELSG